MLVYTLRTTSGMFFPLHDWVKIVLRDFFIFPALSDIGDVFFVLGICCLFKDLLNVPWTNDLELSFLLAHCC